MAATTSSGRDGRPDPERLLRQIQSEDEYELRGKLKIFLGYASGIGKSTRMFDEGRRRHERGQDVVIGALQPSVSDDVKKIIEKLEIIPLKWVSSFNVMDVAAILRRRPGVCLIDGLAYDNPPGSPNAKRWQDVEQLLDAGISVISSVNLQYVEEKREAVERITGKRVTPTVPESFIRRAAEIVIVDAPPETCIAHSQKTGEDPAVLELKLSELREMTLLLAADVVDHQLETYLREHGIGEGFGTRECILVCITARSNPEKMLASARRNADRFHAGLYAVTVMPPEISPEDQKALDQHIQLAREIGATFEMLDGSDPVTSILEFARAHGVTQIFIGHTGRQRWWQRISGSPVDRLIRSADGMDVRVFPH